VPGKEKTNKTNSIFPEWPEKRRHACPVCGWESFSDFFTYEDCPQCGLANGYAPWIGPDDYIGGEWVTIGEGRRIWEQFHCDVNEYAMLYKEHHGDPLPKEAISRKD